MTSISAQFGHANASITQSIYSHVLPRMQHDAAEKLAAALRHSRPAVHESGGEWLSRFCAESHRWIHRPSPSSNRASCDSRITSLRSGDGPTWPQLSTRLIKRLARRRPDLDSECWRAGKDSNPRPSDPKSDALSTELPARAGLPGSSCLSDLDRRARCSRRRQQIRQQRGHDPAHRSFPTLAMASPVSSGTTCRRCCPWCRPRSAREPSSRREEGRPQQS